MRGLVGFQEICESTASTIDRTAPLLKAAHMPLVELLRNENAQRRRKKGSTLQPWFRKIRRDPQNMWLSF